ncbi:hypothetical protein [Methylibium sp.]|uniref:hypothetical protein n=1 Tax=Methylibium sp. TaxID=2067992 RepID=UPI003D151107
MAAFNSIDDVREWVEVRGFGGEKALREAVGTGAFTARNAAFANAYLARVDGEAGVSAAAIHADMQRRGTEAAEASAEAAQLSARHAGTAARWAMFAVIAAVATLALVAWPFIRDSWL